MKEVIFAGNAITADILNSYLERDDRYHVAGFTTDDQYVEAGHTKVRDTIALSRLKTVCRPQDFVVIMAIGYSDLNRSRESMFHRLKSMGYHIETYIHPEARVYTDLLGEGCCVLPGAVVEPHVRLGDNTMVWANATVAHHSSVAANCWVASGAVISGQAQVGRNTFIGVNATIVNEVVVGEYNIVGAGALVTRNTETSSVYLARSGEKHRFPSQEYVRYQRL